jgi:hypothetical protein
MKGAFVCRLAILAAALSIAASARERTTATSAEPLAKHSSVSSPGSIPTQESLPALIRAAKPDFRPVTEQQVAQARDSLQTALSSMQRLLGREPVKRDAWNAYLRWNVLEQQLSAQSPDAGQLRHARKPFVGKHVGLEIEQFRAVRHALEDYAQTLEDRSNRTLQREYEAHLERLAQALEAYLGDPRGESVQEIASSLGWLERRGQADTVVGAVRSALSRPNLFMQLSGNAIAMLVYTSIDETAPVKDVILGTRILGTGRTVGHVSAMIVPNDEVGTVRIEMQATNRSKTIGYSDPVRIYQNNRTNFIGSKQVVIDRAGIRTLPTVSIISAESDLTGLGTTLQNGMVDRMVRRKARQRVDAQDRRANSIVEKRQRRRFSERLDGVVDAQIAECNRQLCERLLWPLIRNDVFPRQFDTRSSREQIEIALQFSGVSQLGAPCNPVALAANTDLAVQVHHSAFENLAADLFAGRTVTAEELMEGAGVAVDQADGGGDSTEQRVAITLTEVDPATLRIDDNVVALTIRGQRYVVRKRAYPPMNITVRYHLEPTGGGLRATRLGAVEIVPPEIEQGIRTRYSMRERAFQRLLRNRVDRRWRKEYVRDGITLAGDLSALGKLNIVQLVADDGWLTLACQRSRAE